MIKIISPQITRNRVKCKNCNSVLEYDSTDIRIQEKQDFICKLIEISKYICCPKCYNTIILENKIYEW